jgi:23S rRNA pseudouridine1911/1915/1917 synthase
MPTPTDKKLERVDKWVQKQVPGLTGRQIDEAIQSGLVLIGGKKAKKGDRTAETAIDCGPIRKHLEEIGKGNSKIQLDVLWETEDEWIVDKPAGMKSYPLSLFDTETPSQWALFREQSIRVEFPAPQPILSPHRLDTGTSGLLIVCRKKTAFEKWRNFFQSHLIQKKYLAWCYGEVEESELTIDFPIAHSISNPAKMIVVSDQAKFRPPIMEATTHARLLKKVKGKSLWEISCSTGVTHQVRVHLAALNLPLVGDKLYDPNFLSRDIQPQYHLLRATELRWENYQVIAPSESYKKGPLCEE